MHYHFATLILAIIGFALSFYIWNKKTRNEELYCIIGEDCNKVIHSEYAETFGIENTVLGMVYYTGIFIISWVSIMWPKTLMFSFFLTSHLIITGLAALVSLYLTFIQLFKIRELCEYCLANTAIILAIFVFMAL